MMWSNRQLNELLEVEHPIVQVPMARASDSDIIIAILSARRALLAHSPTPMQIVDRCRMRSKYFEMAQINWCTWISFALHQKLLIVPRIISRRNNWLHT